MDFKQTILAGIPDVLPEPRPYDTTVNHAPKRKDILTAEQKKLAVRNALRYFDPRHHAVLAPEFARELETYAPHTRCTPVPSTSIPQSAGRQRPSWR